MTVHPVAVTFYLTDKTRRVSERSLWKITRLLRTVTCSTCVQMWTDCKSQSSYLLFFSPSFYPQTLINRSSFIHSNNNNKILNIIVVCLWHHQESGLHGTLQTFPWATPLQYSALELLVSRSVIRYINKYCYKIYTTTLPHKLFCIVFLCC